MITLTIDRNSSGMRLDRYLRKAFPNEGLSTFFSILRKKKVRVNGTVAKAPLILQDGDEVCIYENLKSVQGANTVSALDAQNAEAAKPWGNATQKGWVSKKLAEKTGWVKKNSFADAGFLKDNLNIVLETEDFVIVNKPSGIASQPGSGTRPGESLVELLWQWGEDNELDFKPTIAHRLDQETSGLLVAALHGDTLRELAGLIREHKVQKFYLALVKGNLKKEKGTIEMALERTDNAKGSKMKVGESENAKNAITHYHVYARYEGYDLVKIRLETGKMHQIRAHFAAIGHPLLGDSRYGDFTLNHELKKRFKLNRLFLHSTRLEFDWGDKHIVQDSPLPRELDDVVKQLKRVPLSRER